ncbi:hypothetical protein BCR37DRAFT_210119 [Protomyces lactucae-debilis]|uniref:Uncharacterized protein n=1 Tax=Protomyces lactucae-debilis TaxID=2754530 RepID=A0A1Y2FRM0_PROLT|nr:uncharacterized protein BCR37DRAFT_210119 [Protomyces lactucae-debilis]ORY86227.1 hypothetical protein BCR37DRAFT_210119 [Protomyces lactucae-debilis]
MGAHFIWQKMALLLQFVHMLQCLPAATTKPELPNCGSQTSSFSIKVTAATTNQPDCSATQASDCGTLVKSTFPTTRPFSVCQKRGTKVFGKVQLSELCNAEKGLLTCGCLYTFVFQGLESTDYCKPSRLLDRITTRLTFPKKSLQTQGVDSTCGLKVNEGFSLSWPQKA